MLPMGSASCCTIPHVHFPSLDFVLWGTTAACRRCAKTWAQVPYRHCFCCGERYEGGSVRGRSRDCADGRTNTMLHVRSERKGTQNGSARLGSARLCYVCLNDNNLGSVYRIKEKSGLVGKIPLPLCEYCLNRNITPPFENTTTSFFETDTEARAKKNGRLESLVGKGFHKGHGSPKKKRKCVCLLVGVIS